ncbi:hypothetical protein PFISCL1PPCAC_27339, partial [Pristionchus fissidentatus]
LSMQISVLHLCLLLFSSLHSSFGEGLGKVKRLHFVNWRTNATRLADENKGFSDGPLYKDSDSIGFLCRDVTPAAIHLVPEGQIGDCKNHDEPVANCPNPSKITILNLEHFPQGVYYLTSYSNTSDDGLDEKEGGFCSEGLTLKLEIAEGEAVDWKGDDDEDYNKTANLTEMETIDAIKIKLNLKEVNDVNRQFIESHHLNVSEPEIVNEDHSNSSFHLPFPPFPFTRENLFSDGPSSIARPLIFTFLVLFIFCFSAFGLYVYARRRGVSCWEAIPYITLNNEVPLQDLNPV